jgi:phosphoglycerol transferase MdoB-like AlkP superfamily enzyme
MPVVFIRFSVKYIAQPRMGMVKLSKRRVRNNKRLIMALTIFLIVMVMLTIFGNTSTISEFINPKWIVIGIIFFICIAIAYFMSIDRMYIYAYLFSGTFYLSEEIRENPEIISDGGYAYLFASIVLISIGIVYLVKFLKKNPLPAKDALYDE